MAEDTAPHGSRHSARSLALLAFFFLLGIGCIRVFRFTVPVLNGLFLYLLLLLPFAAIRPLLRLRRWPKVVGFALLIPTLLLCSLALLFQATCGRLADRRPIDTLQTVEQQGYTVKLIFDIGPVLVSPTLYVVQERPLLPGLKIVRTLDHFLDEETGQLTAEGPSAVRLRLPATAERSEEITRRYQLKHWVYF